MAFEVACTLVLLIFTALVARSFSRVLNQDRAFNSGHLMVAQVNLLNPRYDQSGNAGSATRSAFVDRALARLRSNAGVQFAAMQIPLIAGEDFRENEREHPEDAIISQETAQAAWPGEDPLRRTFRINGRTYTVIGIAADARIVSLKQNAPVVYLPYWHDPPSTVFFHIRSSLPLEPLAPNVRSELWDIDPEVAIPVIKSLDTQVFESVGAERFQALVLSCFSVAALMLAALGMYGVLVGIPA